MSHERVGRGKVVEVCRIALRDFFTGGGSVTEIGEFLVDTKRLTPELQRHVPAVLERLVASGEARKRLWTADGESVWVYFSEDTADTATDWPETDPEMLMDYDCGMAALSTFVKGHDVGDVWDASVQYLVSFDAVLRKLISTRDKCGRIPVRCHASLSDTALLSELIPHVQRWRSTGGDLTPEISALSKRLLDAICGAVSEVPGGEPRRRTG